MEDLIDLSRTAKLVPEDTHHHRPEGLFADSADRSRSAETEALVILNTPISSLAGLERVWRKCAYRLCADGGANRLYDLFRGDEPRRQQYLPNIIHGDLDSLRSDVREYYSSHGVTISLDEDQYSTDFGKALNKVRAHFSSNSSSAAASSSSLTSNELASSHQTSAAGNLPPNCATEALDILILGSLSGRVDQGIGLLSEILGEQIASSSFPSNSTSTPAPASTPTPPSAGPPLKLHLISESNLTFLLPPGRNILHFPRIPDHLPNAYSRSPFSKTPIVGILPLLAPATITTRGLKYDVAGWKTQMGGMVSTSNAVLSEEVRVVTDEWVLFTAELDLVMGREGMGG